jgi:homoserine kinase type II
MISLPEGPLVELESFVHWDRGMKTPELLEAGFAELGRLHDLMRSVDSSVAASHAPRANHLPSSRAASLTHLGAERIRGWNDPVLDNFADQVVEHIDAVTAAERSWAPDQVSQLVHGDFWDNNVLFAGDELVAVIDFDFMAERWRIDDLALPIWFYLLEPGHGLPDGADLEIVRRLVAAYDWGTQRPLSRGERLALPLAVARQPAWSAGRWVLQLDDEDARAHARSAVDELPVARAIMTELSTWQAALAPR